MSRFSAFRQPVTAGIAASLFFSGVTFASTLPYGAIVGIEALGIPNAVYAVLLTVGSVVSAIASVMLGYLSDKVDDRRLLVIGCALLGALGYGLVFFIREQWAFFLTYAAIMPFGFALFSQSFSYARTFYNLRHPDEAEFMVSVLRTIFAVAWVIVPPVAGWIAARGQVFDVYGIAALAYVASAIIFALMLRDDRTKIGADTKPADGVETDIPANGIALPVVFGIGGITIIQTALALHVMTTPLAIVSKFGGTLADVGIYASLAALLEVPFMLMWGMAVARAPKFVIIAINAVLYAVYLLLLSRANSVADVLWLQGLNAIATAALISIPISYMQEAIRGRVGLSTSLMDVVRVISTMIAAGVFALVSVRIGYPAVFVAAGALAVGGAVVLSLAHAPWGKHAGAD